jgi:hypothetical protein
MTSEIKVNTIKKASGSTLTLGEAGTTVQIASGATTSGMGRTGTVDWQTSSIKTANFTAANGEGYFCNTTGGAFEVDLPAGTAGNIVAFKDYAGTFDSNNLTIDPNGSQVIGGGVAGQTVTVSDEGASVTLVYVDDTQGWVVVNDARENISGQVFVTATGGNSIVTCGNHKIHVFTAPGNFVVSQVSPQAPNNSADYMIVGGGGAGASNHGGAGGAGGFRESPGSSTSYTASPLGASPAAAITLSATSYPIVIGAGGTTSCSGSTPDPVNRKGSDSSGLGITSAGGGGGGSVNPAPHRVGGAGGSGGGGGSNGDNPGGAGNTPPVNPSQGNSGGGGVNNPSNHGGGGGGATAAGQTASTPASSAGDGGAGASSEIINPSNPNSSSFGSPAMTFAGGGGGGSNNAGPEGSAGAGGGGRGSTGGSSPPAPTPERATAGTANTGGGGGGTGRNAPNGGPAGAGGSGIVMIRYKFQ